MHQLTHVQPSAKAAFHEYPDAFARRVHQAVVLDHLQHGVLFATPSQRLLIPNDLLASTDAVTPPPEGTTQLLSVLSSRDPATGHIRATRRGSLFVTGVFEKHLPGCVTGAWDGASHSWGIVRMSAEHRAAWMEARGMKLRAMQAMLGLRRLSVFQEGVGDTAEQRLCDEFRHAVSTIWREAQIVSFSASEAVLKAPPNAVKERANLSVLSKIYPKLSLKLA